MDSYPNVKRWMTEQVETLPEWQKTQEAVNKGLLPGKSKSEQNVSNGASSGSAVAKK